MFKVFYIIIPMNKQINPFTGVAHSVAQSGRLHLYKWANLNTFREARCSRTCFV